MYKYKLLLGSSLWNVIKVTYFFTDYTVLKMQTYKKEERYI